jgi:hypothetical protein
MNRSFRYKRLIQERKQIRLVRVNGESVDDIACNIEHFDLNNQTPEYQALSYTWGSPYPGHRIKLNNKRFYVLDNLYEFLRSFQRQVIKDSKCYYLWIDQVCINQDDEDEKSWQVQMMALIYQSATGVITWVGLANEHTPMAVWLLELLEDDRKLLRQALPLYQGQWLSGSMLQAYKDLIRSAPQRQKRVYPNSHEDGVILCGRCKDAVWNFLDNPYWTRLWIVQEIMLARSLTVWWGEYRISMDALEGVTQKIKVTYKDIILTPWNRLSVILNWGLGRETALGYDQPSNVNVLLSDLVRFFSANGCKDRRDKVFGLMALVRGPSVLKVDYSMAVADVYLAAVRAMGQGTVHEAERLKRVLERSDWEEYVKACYILGMQMLPDRFGSLPTHLSYNTADAGKILGFDQDKLLRTLPDSARAQYMVEHLKVFLEQ